MQEQINRVAADLEMWRNREERFEKIFPGTLRNNRPFLKEKLDHLDNLQAKYASTLNEEERVTLRILKQERNDLAKTVYPSVLARLVRYLLLPFKQRQTEQMTMQQSAGNLQSLKETVIKSGFGQIANQMEQQIRQGQNAFSIPVNYYVNEKERMSFDVSFFKDQTGQYQLESYKASLSSEQKPAESRQQQFQLGHGELITADQAYNLLAGRAIRHEQSSANGSHQETWKQLDFNDRDIAGNYKMKVFPSAYGYDIKQAVQQLPLKELLSANDTEKLFTALASGNRETVTMRLDGVEKKLHIEANPQFKSLNIYDDQLKKVSLSSVLSNNAIRAEKQATHKIPLKKVLNRAKKNGMSAN